MADVYCLQFAALYTVQDGLARDPKYLCRFDHGDVSLRCAFDEMCFDFLVYSYPPRSAGGNLLTGNEPFIEPTMHNKKNNAEDLCSLFHNNRLAF